MSEDITKIQAKKKSPWALRCPNTGEVHSLSGEMMVGREVECDIQLASRQVSRYHAKLYVSANGLIVEDMNSSNGTFVNGNRIYQRTHLTTGDQVCFDDLLFCVIEKSSLESDVTRISTSQKVSRGSVEAINRIGAEKLRPAPPTPQEVQREFDAPYYDDQANPAANSPATVYNNKNPKVHEIPDMDDFLKFAGSGLQAQEKPAHKDASPFGLARHSQETQVVSANAVNEILKRTEGMPPAEARQEHIRPIPSQADLSKVDDLSSLSEPKPAVARQEHVPHEPPVPVATMQEAAVENVAHNVGSDEDTTHFLSMRRMEEYSVANKHHAVELNVGTGPRLIAMTAPVRGKVFELSTNEDVKCWSIGRDESADICIRDRAVSREHAWITKLDTIYELRVNEMASGILVNDQMAVDTALRHGDRLQIGTMELQFRLDAGTPKFKEEQDDQEHTWFERACLWCKELVSNRK